MSIYKTVKTHLIAHKVDEDLAAKVAQIIGREGLTGIINRTPEEQAKVWEAWAKITNSQPPTASN